MRTFLCSLEAGPPTGIGPSLPACSSTGVFNCVVLCKQRTPVDVDEPMLENSSKQFDQGHRADQLLLVIVSSNACRFVEIATK
jgi:hypothetical protein